MSDRKAPWPDFNGSPLFEGDIIVHPSKETGVIVYLPGHEHPADSWRVDYGDGTLSRLSLQIGDKGQAVKSED